MMGVTVREKKPGEWWVFVNHRGRRTSKRIGDKRQAEKIAKDLRAALARGDLGLLADADTAPVLTFGAYADRYLRDAEHTLKRSTWMDYESNVKLHLKPAFGNRPLGQIARAEVKQLALALRRSGLRPKSARKIVGTLSTILSEALDDDLIESNPCLQLRKVYRSPDFAEGEPGAAVNPPTRDELAHLLATARDHTVQRGDVALQPFRSHYPLLLLLARTGLRVGEAIALKWGDVDWRGGFIEVQRAYVRGQLTTPKNHKARRVDLSQQLKGTLEELYRDRFERIVAIDAEAQAALEADRAAALEAWIFPDTAGGLMDADNFRHRVFMPLLKAAELRHIRIHDLRHTYASLLIEAGKELQYIQQQLGHHSAAFTLSVYGHLLPRDRRGEVNCLDDQPAPIRTPGAPGEDGTESAENERPRDASESQGLRKLRGEDLNLRPSGYEPDELPDCSTPLHRKRGADSGAPKRSQRLCDRCAASTPTRRRDAARRPRAPSACGARPAAACRARGVRGGRG